MWLLESVYTYIRVDIKINGCLIPFQLQVGWHGDVPMLTDKPGLRVFIRHAVFVLILLVHVPNVNIVGIVPSALEVVLVSKAVGRGTIHLLGVRFANFLLHLLNPVVQVGLAHVVFVLRHWVPILGYNVFIISAPDEDGGVFVQPD